MKSLQERIRIVDPSELQQDCFRLEVPGAVATFVVPGIDPAKCYLPDCEVVVDVATFCESVFPMDIPPLYFLLPHEPEGRAGAIAYELELRGGARTTALCIFGKRIPIPNSCLRYLVAHEYSHHVDHRIRRQQGLSAAEFDAMYAKMRGVPIIERAPWHQALCEIIANDCRIAVFGVDPDFWPHECPHPDKCPEVKAFWAQMKSEMKE